MKVNCQGVGDSQRSVSSSHWRKAQSESGVAKKCIPALPLKAFRMAVRADFIKQMKVACGRGDMARNLKLDIMRALQKFLVLCIITFIHVIEMNKE